MLEQLKTNTNVIKIIKFGSVVYKTETCKSDVDYIVIVTDDYEIVDRQLKTENEDFTFYRESEWLKMIDDCDIRCLETESSSIYEKEIIEDNWNDDKSWEYFKEKYQPLYNKLKTQFKLEHKKRGMKI